MSNAPRMLTAQERDALRQDLKDTLATLKKIREEDASRVIEAKANPK